MNDKPPAIDMSLCINEMCSDKCKRFYKLWKPNEYHQSYINPVIEYDENGNQKECKCKLKR